MRVHVDVIGLMDEGVVDCVEVYEVVACGQGTQTVADDGA